MIDLNAQRCHDADQPAGWAQDVKTVTTTVLTTTGGTLWSAAERCRQFLEAMAAELDLYKPGIRVLELGAGCGTLGLTVARNCPQAAEVGLTEQAYGGALQHLRTNVAANATLPHMGSVSCCACDWTHFTDAAILQAAADAARSRILGSSTHLSDTSSTQQDTPMQQLQDDSQAPSAEMDPAGNSSSEGSTGVSREELLDLHKLVSTPWDIIIGSDLVYNTAGAHALPKVLGRLMQPISQQHKCQLAQQQAATPQGHSAGPTVEQQPEQLHGLRLAQQQRQQQPQEPSQHGSSPHESCSRRMVVGLRCESPSRPVMYYAHTKHRYDNMDVVLFQQLEAEGLSVEEVVEAGQQLPPPSPPPFSSLFPDMHCAVFKIYRAS